MIPVSRTELSSPQLFFKSITPLFQPKNVGGNRIFNPGTTSYQRKQLILPRLTRGEIYPTQPFESWIALASLRGGLQYPGDLEPIQELTPNRTYPCGFEDPRITKLGRDYHIVATGYDGNLPHIVLCTTRDFHSFSLRGEIGPRNTADKDAFFHPEIVMVNGNLKIMLYHRVSDTGNIQCAFVDKIEDLLGTEGDRFWEQELTRLNKRTLLKSRSDTWENHIGGGVPPVKTSSGWLFIYHAAGSDGVYRGGLAMLDLNKPWRVIAKSPYPILEPTLDHEVIGAVNNVVFPQGAQIINEKSPDPILYLYYGGADTNTCIAKAKLNDLISYIMQFDTEGAVLKKQKRK